MVDEAERKMRALHVRTAQALRGAARALQQLSGKRRVARPLHQGVV